MNAAGSVIGRKGLLGVDSHPQREMLDFDHWIHDSGPLPVAQPTKLFFKKMEKTASNVGQ
jgi:hypothetical protein